MQGAVPDHLARVGYGPLDRQALRRRGPGEILAFYFAKADNASSDIATGFRDAMAEVNALAAETPDEVRAVLPEYTEIDPAIIEKLVMPSYVADSVRASSVQRYAELMTTYGLVDEMSDYEALLP